MSECRTPGEHQTKSGEGRGIGGRIRPTVFVVFGFLLLAWISAVIGMAGTDHGWFKNDYRVPATSPPVSFSLNYGTQQICLSFQGVSACETYSNINAAAGTPLIQHASQISSAGATALAFSVLAFVVLLVVCVLTVLLAIDTFVKGFFKLVVIVGSIVAGVFFAVAWATFLAVVMHDSGQPLGKPNVDYALIFSIIGMVFSIVAAVLTLLLV